MDGKEVVLRISDQGLEAIKPAKPGILTRPVTEQDPSDIDAAAAGKLPDAMKVVGSVAGSTSLREASTTLLEAWDACPAQDTTDNEISRAVEALRVALKGRRSTAGRPSGTPREGTKQETVLALLRRPEGATIAQVMEATGWQQHTVRGFFAGLKKRHGITVAVLERVRLLDPGAQGSRGSHSIYAVAA